MNVGVEINSILQTKLHPGPVQSKNPWEDLQASHVKAQSLRPCGDTKDKWPYLPAHSLSIPIQLAHYLSSRVHREIL